jgi:predicted PurR-regulated permease PerM
MRLIDTRPPVSEASRLQVRNYSLTIIAAGVVVAILYWARVVFVTATVAVIIALILQPFVALLVRLRFPRGLAALVVCVLGILAVYLVGAAAWAQIAGLPAEVPAFKERLSSIVEDVSTRLRDVEDSTARVFMPRKTTPSPLETPPPVRSRRRKALTPQPAPASRPPGEIQEVRIHQDTNPLIDYIYSRLSTLYQFMLMASFVPFLVYFMLSWQDHIHRNFLRFFDGPDRTTVSRSIAGIAGMARAFVVGNFLIGIITAVIGSAAFAALRLPFPLLAGVLSGFLSLFPYIGIALALIPPLFAAVAGGAAPTVVVGAAAIAAGIHLFAMNVLYPKLVGARVHLNPLIVTFALMFFGFLWDGAGLVLAIPITAGVKAVCDNVAALRPYGRFLGD